MNGIEAHAEWLESIGVAEQPGISPFAGTQFDRLPAPRSWPSDLVEWYDARLWDRFGDLKAVGLKDVGSLFPPMASNATDYELYSTEFKDLVAQGLYPKSPALLWQEEKGLTVLAETDGPDAGALYWMDVVDARDGFAGRLCTSILEYLDIVRALVGSDVLSPHEDPVWVAAAWEPDRCGELCPPLDTPGPIVGVPWPTVGACIPGLTNPVAPSLAELLTKSN